MVSRETVVKLFDETTTFTPQQSEEKARQRLQLVVLLDIRELLEKIADGQRKEWIRPR